MELTQEQTKKINDFLEGIGVDYIDIRHEMVDHIASEIEEKVSDTDAFFENQRFQTIFVKYMLSKKDALQKKYQKIVKRRFWADIKTISKDILRLSIYPKNLIILILILTLIPNLSQYNTEYTLYLLYGFSLVMFFISISSLSKLMKKYGNIKFVQTYISLFTGLTYIPIWINSINNNWLIYIQITALYLTFLLFKSFESKKENIENKYKYLI